MRAWELVFCPQDPLVRLAARSAHATHCNQAPPARRAAAELRNSFVYTLSDSCKAGAPGLAG